MRLEDLGHTFVLKIVGMWRQTPPVERTPEWRKFSCDGMDFMVWSNGLRTRILQLLVDGSTKDVTSLMAPESMRWAEPYVSVAEVLKSAAGSDEDQALTRDEP